MPLNSIFIYNKIVLIKKMNIFNKKKDPFYQVIINIFKNKALLKIILKKMKKILIKIKMF